MMDRKTVKYSIDDFNVGDGCMPYENWLKSVLDYGNGRDVTWRVIEIVNRSLLIEPDMKAGIEAYPLAVPIEDVEYKLV